MWNCCRPKGLFYWIKIIICIKLFKIRGTCCYDINVTCIYFPKNDLLKSLKFEFLVSFQYLLHLKKIDFLIWLISTHFAINVTFCNNCRILKLTYCAIINEYAIKLPHFTANSLMHFIVK